MSNFKIVKTTVECYKMRHTNGMYWADITIDSGDHSGRISISSDYGNWANFWNSCGSSFKDFLCSINIGYFAGKVGEDRWFDIDKTIAMYKRKVIQDRKDDNIDQDQARTMFKEIESLEECNTQEYFIHCMFSCKSLVDLYDGCPDTVTSINPLFQKFWDGPWQEFIAELKKEKTLSETSIV